MRVDKDTTLCISIAGCPSNFGTTLHNAAYQALKLNFVYKAFAVADLDGAIRGVRALGIRGCSVSMPFKEQVLEYVDAVDYAAGVIGAVNTVVNDDGRLTGYNTDHVGAAAALEASAILPDEEVLLLGAGGMARAILYALRQRGCTIVRVAARDRSKVDALQSIMPCMFVEWALRDAERSSVVINATSIGMAHQVERLPVSASVIQQCRVVLDVVVSATDTPLVQMASEFGKDAARGSLMSLHQAAAQFQLYTGLMPPMAVLERSLGEFLQ